MGPGSRRRCRLRLPYGVQKGGSHEAHFVHLSNANHVSRLDSVPAETQDRARAEGVLTRDGPFVAMDWMGMLQGR